MITQKSSAVAPVVKALNDAEMSRVIFSLQGAIETYSGHYVTIRRVLKIVASLREQGIVLAAIHAESGQAEAEPHRDIPPPCTFARKI